MIHIICSWNAPKSKKIQLVAIFFLLKHKPNDYEQYFGLLHLAS
jgi:hypothetical protein